MARLALAVGGAVAGFIVGGPAGAQVGWMAGSIAGSLIPQTMRGPSIEEAGAQTTSEGAPRAIVYGAAPVTGNVIDAGRTRKITRKERQGKGGASVETEALLRTYAIRMCEGPIAAVLMAKKDGKIVYDVRPGADFEADSTKFLAGCRIYLGDEEQMPDPDLEAIRGVGEVPAHRGSAYIVFVDDDVTDRRGSVPQYEFVVARKVSQSGGGLVAGPELASPTTWIDVDADGLPYAITGREQLIPGLDEVRVGGALTITKWEKDFSDPTEFSWVNAGDSAGSDRLWVMAARDNGIAVSYDGNNGLLKLINNGGILGYVAPDASAPPPWYYNEPGYSSPDRRGSLVWMTDSAWYIGIRQTSVARWNRVCKFGYEPSTEEARSLPSATIFDVNADPEADEDFAIHLSRQGKLRILNRAPSLRRYSQNLVWEADEIVPAEVAGITALAFGADDERDLLLVLTAASATASLLRMFRLSSGELLTTHEVAGAPTAFSRIVFSSTDAYIQYGLSLYRLGLGSSQGEPELLSEIVADIHARCGIPAADYDVTELTDSVDGLVLASAGYSGADAIGTLRVPYFFDRAEWGGKLRYPKRGKPTVATITLDDLVEEPDESERQAQIEYPRKYHLTYQSAAVNYEAAQATSDSSSPDVRVTGESALQVPVVLTPARAAEIVAILHKVSRTEADGEVKFSLPDSWLRLVPSDCVALNLRGTSRRLRIDGIEMAGGIMQLTTHVDRQSAYASTTGYVPLPTPTPPASGVVGDSVLAVLDVPTLRDDDDALYYYAAATGERDAWRGAQLQRSLDGGASYVDALGLDFAATIGRLASSVPAASPWYTDRTNVIEVDLIRPGDSLDSVTDAQFLQRAGAIALQLPDGSWEVAQYRDAVHVSGSRWQLSTLHRGQLNTPAAEHVAGALLVLLDDVSRVTAQSAWLQRMLTHRAPSYGGTVESAVPQMMTYAGRAQREWPVASLRLVSSGGPVGGSIVASWAPRHRLGTDVSPVASQHFRGFRVYVTDASGQSTTQDLTAQSVTLQLGSMTWPVRVHVAAVNAITGAGQWVWRSTDGTAGEGDGPPGDDGSGEPPVGDGTWQRGLTMIGSAAAGARGQIISGDVYAAQNSGASWQIWRLRADTLELIRGAYAGPYLFSLINDGAALYAGSSGYVRKFGLDLELLATVQVGGTGDAQSLALCGGVLWVACPYTPEVVMLDPGTLASAGTGPALRINTLTTDGTYLYGASRGDNCIYKLDGTTGALVDTFPTADFPADVLLHAGKLWVTSLQPAPRLLRYDAGTGAQEAFELGLTNTPGSLGIAGDVLGVGGRNSFAIDTTTGQLLGSFSIPDDSPSQVAPPMASIISPTRFIAGAWNWTAYYDLQP